MAEGTLSPALRAQLDDAPLSAIAEYLFEALGHDEGRRRIDFHGAGGTLQRADIQLGPLRPEELDKLDRRDERR